MTINHYALGLTMQGPPSVQDPAASVPAACPLLETFVGQDWRPVQPCSLKVPPPRLLTSDGLYTTSKGATHPTGMLSCLFLLASRGFS